MSVFLILNNFELTAQEKDPIALIDSLRSRLETIADYTAELEIDVDVEFIRIPVKHATIYYKKPDKVKFISDEFIMLPKRGLNPNITSLLTEPYTAIYLGQEINEEDTLEVIRIVPLGKNPEINVATWWINSNSFLIVRNESSSSNQGTYTVDFIYSDPSVPLPTEMIFSFDIEKMQIPLQYIGKSKGSQRGDPDNDHPQKGNIRLRISDYKINSGLPDKLFEDIAID